MGFMYACDNGSPLNSNERREKNCVSLGAGWIHVLTKLTIMVCLGLYVLCMHLPQLDSRNKGIYADICLYAAVVGGVCVLIQALDYLLVFSNQASNSGMLSDTEKSKLGALMLTSAW